MIVQITSATTNVAYWKQERLVLVFDGAGDILHMWSSLSGSYASPIAKYTPDTNGYVFVDITDYIRAYGGCSIYLKDEAADANLCTINITVKGLINPLGVVIPYHYEEYYAKVIAPLHMIAPESGKSLLAEVYYQNAACYLTGSATLATNNRYLTVTGDFSCKFNIQGTPRQYHLKPRLCGMQYAYVRWQSFTGVTRLHIFEVSKPTMAADGSYNLMPRDNEYVEIKGRVDGMTLRLRDLSAYDLWYYADIITSSSVEVSLDGTNYTQVQVTTKNYTLPDGETKINGKLEIAINWKRYDAVTM